MKEIIVASKNKGKITEIAAVLAGLPVTVLDLDKFGDIPEVEETGDTFTANAILKARHYAFFTGKACLADDSGLEVEALSGAPGVYSARYAGEGASDEINNRKLLNALSGVAPGKRNARFRCVLAFIDTDGKIITADGVCEGVILEKPQGAGGFGYDPLFYIPELGQTLAEISVSDKNAISHRGQALRNMSVKLAEHIK